MVTRFCDIFLYFYWFWYQCLTIKLDWGLLASKDYKHRTQKFWTSSQHWNSTPDRRPWRPHSVLVFIGLSLTQEKRHWRRYVYLWINYALFEELETQDMERTRQVYEACLQLLPHKKFTFAKIWILFAHFEVRQKELQKARKILVGYTECQKCRQREFAENVENFYTEKPGAVFFNNTLLRSP